MGVIEERKAELNNLERVGKKMEEKNPRRDWRSYNREMNRKTQQYTSLTRKRREDKEEEAIHNSALEFTDSLFTSRSKSFSVPDLPWKKEK